MVSTVFRRPYSRSSRFAFLRVQFLRTSENTRLGCYLSPSPPLGGDRHFDKKAQEIPGAKSAEDKFSPGYIGTAAALVPPTPIKGDHHFMTFPPPPLHATSLTSRGGITRGGRMFLVMMCCVWHGFHLFLTLRRKASAAPHPLPLLVAPGHQGSCFLFDCAFASVPINRRRWAVIGQRSADRIQRMSKGVDGAATSEGVPRSEGLAPVMLYSVGQSFFQSQTATTPDGTVTWCDYDPTSGAFFSRSGLGLGLRGYTVQRMQSSELQGCQGEGTFATHGSVYKPQTV